MSSILNNGVTGLLAAQFGLRTTSHNVANVNTPGFSRQRIEQAALAGQLPSGPAVGAGVRITDINRLYDQFVTEQLLGASTRESRAVVISQLATRLDGTMGDPDAGPGSALQSFFDSIAALGRDALSGLSRQGVLEGASELVARFHQLDSFLGSIDDEINRQLASSVTRVNDLAASIAKVNEEIVAAGGGASGDLLDQRDTLVRELATMVDVDVRSEANGALTVAIGSGQPLVLGIRSFELTTIPDEFDGSRLQVGYVNGPATESVSRRLTGGVLGGLLSFRTQVADPARMSLGQLALGIAGSMNAQHRAGMDLNGNLGGDLFGGQFTRVFEAGGNTGTATVTAAIADFAAIAARDYEVRFDGAGWTVTDANTGATIPSTGSGTVADPLLVDGLALTLGGTPDIGDSFVVQAASVAANTMTLLISDPTLLAAALPVRADAGQSNAGDSFLAGINVADASDPALLDNASIRFDDANTYRIFDAGGTDVSGPLAYVPGAEIAFNGWVARISGTPAGGDRFNISANSAGSSDNANALALSARQSAAYLDGGRLSLDQVAAGLTAFIGTAALRGEQDLAIQSNLRQQAELDREAVAGVNLDEEAINLIRFQEAYLASSKVISVANDLFNSILQAVDN